MTARAGLHLRWLPVLAALAVAVAWRGGYVAEARAAAAVLAGLAALAALTLAPAPAGQAARHPIVVSLAVLGAITALSALWTTGAPADAIRDGASVLALAALVVAAASLPAPRGHCAVLLVAGLATAIVGLGATMARADPQALEICGTWRPAGPFEYPPALALVCVGALPIALFVATERRRVLAAAGALAAWLLAMTIALTANRLGVGLGALAVTAFVALAPRARSVGPMALAVIVAAVAGTLLLQGNLADSGSGARALAVLAAVVVLGAALLMDGARAAGTSRGRWTALVAVAGIAATVTVVLADRGGPCGGDPSHGRGGIWRAALATAADRPLQGYGARTFLAASRVHQFDERPVPTRYAHDLVLQEWVELGIAGLLAILAWYAAIAWTLVSELRRARPRGPPADSPGQPANLAIWLLGPAVLAFPLANLLDWPWELLGTGALWTVAVGGVLAAGFASSRSPGVPSAL